MASVDAAINVVVNNLNRIKELEDKLKGIEGTIGAVQDLMERGVTGRATTVETYIRAVQELSKSLGAVAQEATGISKVNSELKQRILLESKLRREQSRVARLSRAFDVETRGLDQTKGSLLKIKQQFDEVSKALKQAFKIQDVGLISQLRNELSALIEDQREYNRVLAGTKNTGIDTDFLKEQARRYKLQIDQLRRRASALTENEEIIRKLTAAEYNLVKQRTKEGTFTSFADPRLGREILANVKAQIAAEEQLARERQRASDAYLQQQKNARREILQTVNIIAGTAKKAAGATFDALTFGQGGKIARGAQNAAIRGGVGLGALGLGKLTAGVGTAAAATAGFMTQGPQALVGGPAIAIIEKFAQVLNSALGGIPDAVAQALSSIGQIPDSLGLAAVAAFALAPAMSTAAKSVYNLGKAAGDTAFGQPVAKFLREVNPLAGAAFGSVQALQQGLDKLRGQQLDLQAIASSAAAVNDKLNESYRKLPLALPAKGGSSFQGVIEYDPGIGAFAGGGARKVLSNAEFLVGATGNLAARSEEAAAATLMFAERLGNGATEATIAANKLEEGAQSAKRIAEYVKQAQERRQSSAETPAQRFIRENIERGRRIRENEQSVQIARERSRALLGAQYSLLQIPARGELFPGGRTETWQPQYREMLNNAARVGQLQQEILESMSKQQGFAATLGQLERRTINDKGQSLAIQKQENEELERSIQIIRARNKELRQRPIAAMEPEERVQQGILDPVSLRQSRRNRVARGRALQESRTRALSEGLIGGAFPLLFGQGVGAAVGGGAGGAAGGFMGGGFGFGLSLIGTALGTAFDTFNNNLKELASSLKDPTSSLEAMKTAGLRVTPELEYFVQKLDSSGRAVEAQQRVFEELERQLGAGMVDQLRALNSEQKELDRQWQELSATLVTSLLPAITGTVAIVNDVIGGFKSLGSVKLPPWLSKSLGLATEAQMGIASVAAPGFGISRFFLQNALNGGRQEAKAQAGKGESLTPQKQEEALRGQIQAAQEIRSLRQQGADIERSSAELRLGIEDTIYGFRRRAEDMAREGIEFRRSMENEIFNKRQDLDRQIIENDRRRQQNAIDAFDLQLQRASIGIDPIARGIVDAGRDYFRIVAEALADKEQSEKQLALDIAKINRDADQYSLEIEDRIYQMTRQREEFSRDVSRAKTQAEYQIQDYIIKVEQYRVEMAQKRVDLALQEGKILDASAIAERTGLSTGGQSVATIASRNKTPLEKALLATIRFAEGTAGPQGYRTMFGGGLFSDMSRHPNKVVRSGGYASAAAGAYQFLPGTWATTGGGAMTPERQDAAAIYLAQRRGVDINRMGFTPQVASMLAPEWASFPTMKGGSFYGQPAKTYQQLKAYFDRALAEYSKQKPTGGNEWGFSIPAGFPGAQAPVDKYGLTVGAQAAPTSQSASAAPGIGTFVGGGRASIASAQSMARDMSMPIPPSPPSLPQWPSAPALIKVNDLQEKNNELARESVKIRQAGSEAERESIRNKIEEAQLAVTAKARAPIDAIQEQTQSLLDDIELRKLRNRLLIEGVSPAIVEGEVRIAEITRTSNRLIAEQDKLLASLLGVQYDGTNAIYEMALARLKELQVMQPGNVELEKERLNLEGILKARQGILEATGGAVAGAADIAAMEALPGQQIQGFIAEATAELYNLESVAISVSQGIGNAVGSSIANGISGLVQETTTAKEVFANFLTDVGQLLVQEGTKMIATYVAIGIAKMFAGLGGASNAFGPGGAPNFSGAFGATGPSFNPGAFSMGPLAADGAYFSNGIAAFAMGGAFTNSIVSSPTLFQFADGGALKAGVMGEAGPEAIMPLERGPDGRLGVRASLSVPFESGSVMPDEELDSESSQSDTTRMRRLAAAAGSSLRIPFSSVNGAGADAVGAGFAGAAPSVAVDSSTSPVETLIRFESTVINGVEFVTRQEAEQIGLTAAARGADLAQRRLKNNPQARRSIGI